MPKRLYLYAVRLCLFSVFFAGHASNSAKNIGEENKKNREKLHSQYGATITGHALSDTKKIKLESENIEKTAKLTWEILEDIEYVERKHKRYGTVYFPSVSDKLRRLAGKQVQISGFVIPISMVDYAISKNLMASCFFCGEGGPESIAEINFKGKTPQLKTDQHITIQGKFRFNETDPDEWIYFIDEAFIVKE